jgi:hypothetical protein
MTTENLTADQRILVQQIIDNVAPKVKEAARQADLAHQCYYQAMAAKYPEALKMNPGTPLYNSPALSPVERRELAELTTRANATYSDLELHAAEAARKLEVDPAAGSGPSLASIAALEVVANENPKCVSPPHGSRGFSVGEAPRMPPRSPSMSA